MLFKSDTLSRIYTKSGTEILLFRFSRLWYALTSKQQYNNPRHIVHTVFLCFGCHEFTRFRKTKTFSGAKVLLFSDICKRKGLFYIFCGHLRQINTLKAAEAALNFSLVKKKCSPLPFSMVRFWHLKELYSSRVNSTMKSDGKREIFRLTCLFNFFKKLDFIDLF